MWDPKAEGKKGREGDLWHRLSEILKRVIWTNSTAESKSILLGLDTPPPPVLGGLRGKPAGGNYRCLEPRVHKPCLEPCPQNATGATKANEDILSSRIAQGTQLHAGHTADA